MDYEKKYKEALERAKEIKEKIIYSRLSTESCKAVAEYIDTIIPELTESEDEKIREDIINLIYWLKGNPSLCSQYYKDRYDGMLAYLEKQKEQSFTHHEIDESLCDAVTHQMEDDGDVDDFVRKGIDDIVLKYAELGARWQKEQKPTEWSEEDENTRRNIIARLESLSEYETQSLVKAYLQKEIDWLKSLRPSWKPSEEQMEAIKHAYNSFPDYCPTKLGLKSLYEQLKKL